MIMANALGIAITILDERADGSTNKIVLSPESGQIPYNDILIHRRGDHFNGLVPSSSTDYPCAPRCKAELRNDDVTCDEADHGDAHRSTPNPTAVIKLPQSHLPLKIISSKVLKTK